MAQALRDQGGAQGRFELRDRTKISIFNKNILLDESNFLPHT